MCLFNNTVTSNISYKIQLHTPFNGQRTLLKLIGRISSKNRNVRRFDDGPLIILLDNSMGNHHAMRKWAPDMILNFIAEPQHAISTPSTLPPAISVAR